VDCNGLEDGVVGIASRNQPVSTVDLDATLVQISDVKFHLNFLTHLPTEMIERLISGTTKGTTNRIESGVLELRQLRFEPPALMWSAARLVATRRLR
jgi:hypothetical protein